MNITSIIIEDEPLASQKLEGFIREVSFLKLLGSFEKPTEGLHFLKTNSVDLMFLDIQMERLTGIQLLETLTIKPYVIITSAYSDYALKGFELSVFDYLLKPYSFERFLSSVNHVYDDLQWKQISKKSESNIFVKTEYRTENILVDEILFIEGMREYLQICMNGKKIMTKQNFKSILSLLPQEKFIQVHKSWVVSIPKIESIERSRIKIGNQLIPIGDSFKDTFWEHIHKK